MFYGICIINSFWYSWSDVEDMANILNIPTVPVLWRGSISSENELKSMIDDIMRQPSTFGKEKEGIVMRIADEFAYDDFSKYVCKYVRANHVQTDCHWTKNWKKVELKKDRL